jgi:chromosome segregation ATPase
MSIVTSFLTIIQKAVFALFIIPAAFKLIEFIHNLIQTVAHLRDSLKAAEIQIRQLRTVVEDLQEQITTQSKTIHDQMMAIMDMQQQLVDHSIDAISATKEIGDIYECLDLLDDRLLDLVKTEKTRKIKKQVRKDKRKAERQETEQNEIEALDHLSDNEEIFDKFIADNLKSDPEGVIGASDLQKLFKDWYKYYHEDDNHPSNKELREYMCRNFNWDGHFWKGICDNIL